MKKSFAIIAAGILLSLGANAQTQGLSKIETVSGSMSTQHFYTETGKIDSTATRSTVDGQQIYTAIKYAYDSEGNLIENKTYQQTETGIYEPASIINYTWDDQGRLGTRTNYDVMDGEAVFGGVYAYVYDSEGRLTERNLYADEAQTQQFDRTTYTYNDLGQLESEASYLIIIPGIMEMFSAGTEYHYTDDGHIQEKVSFIENNPGERIPTGGIRYTYDKNGNICECTSYTDTPDNILQKEVYSYNLDLSLADIALPVNQEDDYTVALNSNNAITKDELYTPQAGELALYDTYNYTYTPLSSGVDPVIARELTPVTAFVGDEGLLHVNNLEAPTRLNIFSLDGRMVESGICRPDGTIDVSTLPTGVYLLATPQGTVKFVK